MASADEYAAWIVKNADKRGTPDFETIAKAYQDTKSGGSDIAKQNRQLAQETADRETYNPTNGMGGVEKFVAGYGKAGSDMVRGIGQRIGSVLPDGAVKALGLPSQADIDESKRLDAPLMKTGAATVGNIGGNIASALPALAIPGAGSVLGATAIGAGLGFIQPTATGENPLKNAALGGALGGGAVVTGQLAGAGYRGLKAIAEPFTAAGPQRIAGRTIQRFAEDPSRIANVTNAPTITGSLPTLAEQTGDVGLARLQDSLRSVDPQINNALATRAATNNGARVNALREMAGQDGARDFAVANRQGTAGPMYEDAFKVVPDAVGMGPEQARTMATLMRSPDVKKAMADARAIAANNGTNVGPANATGSIEGLHNMKMALDDAIAAAKTAGNTNRADSIKVAQKNLVGLIEDLSPEYKTARTVYAEMSQPINQMDIAAQVAKKGFSNGSDLSGNPTINRNALLGAMKDEPALMRQATGRNMGGSLADVMEPQQLNMLRTIAAESDRAGAVATAGNGPGSATAQRLASQNILRQVITPGGTSAAPTLGQKIGQAVVDNTLANTVVGKATNWLYSGIAEPKIQNALAKAVLNPEEARAAIAAAQQQGVQLPGNLLTRLLGQARRLTGGASAQSARQP